MKLERLSSKIVAVVEADDPVDLAIQQMWQLSIRHLPVVRGGVPVGMLSDRDVLFHVCWLEHSDSLPGGKQGTSTAQAMRVEQIMTKPVVALSPDDPIEIAARLMVNKRIGSVPLVAQGVIVGIVTETDFLSCFNDPACLVPGQKIRQDPVLDRMSAHVHTVRPNDATLTAIRMMRDKQVRHTVVMDDEQLVGIISDRDVLRGSPRPAGNHAVTAWELRLSHEHLAENIMTRRPQVISLDATMSEAASAMVKHKIGALPVVENGKLSGIITETDLLRALVNDCRNEP